MYFSACIPVDNQYLTTTDSLQYQYTISCELSLSELASEPTKLLSNCLLLARHMTVDSVILGRAQVRTVNGQPLRYGSPSMLVYGRGSQPAKQLQVVRLSKIK